jgi:uncharacterized repeat protein (TIGR03803 family)
MKTFMKKLLLLPALIGSLDLMPVGRVVAQTYTNLHSFTNSDGAHPLSGLILSGNTLYGTTSSGGALGNGAVFGVNTSGTGFTNLHSFNFGTGDGITPRGGLVLSGNTLYGTTVGGGSSHAGIIFAVNTDSSGYTNLHTFTGSDGGNPYAHLILSGNKLYGTTRNGGSSGNGTVFAVNTNGTGFTNLYSFTALSSVTFTNTDGANPQAGLILSGNTLYGTTYGGGYFTRGTVFAVNTDSTGFTNLHNFGYIDGANPNAGLILSGNTLYGTAGLGGGSGYGTVFAINTNGTGFTNLYNFTGPAFNNTNTDGVNPTGDLILSGNTLYGVANAGGYFNQGTMFAVNTNGTGFTNLHNFTSISGPLLTNIDGTSPSAGLILSGNTLYGTADNGGGSGYGTVFSLSFPVLQLAITRFGTNVIVTWPTNFPGFTLISTTNLVSPVVWVTNSSAPVVVNGQNTVTNRVSGARNFFLLKK